MITLLSLTQPGLAAVENGPLRSGSACAKLRAGLGDDPLMVQPGVGAVGGPPGSGPASFLPALGKSGAGSINATSFGRRRSCCQLPRFLSPTTSE